MDVRCERCGTEYDFDDALVSERGTTVKCTNCGHQFKVFPRRVSAVGPERWIVRLARGGVISFTSLRELQKGIAAGRVGPADQLSRGGQAPRPLGSIAELEPFFQTAVPHAGVGGRTLAGVAPPIRPDGSLPPQPFLPSKSDPPPAMTPAPERKRGTTVPRFPTFEASGAPAASDPATQRVVAPPPDAAPSPATQSASGAEGQAGVVVPGPLRGDTAGTSSDAVPGGPTKKPAMDSTQRSITGIADLGGTLRMDSPAADEAPARAGDAGAERSTAEPAADEPGRDVARAHVEQRDAAAVDPPPQPGMADDAGGHRTSADASDPLPRRVPEVEPIEPPPTDATQAVAARTEPRIQADTEKFFTPPPRELSFSGSLSDPDPRYVPEPSGRGPRARWIVGVVMLGALALLAGTVGLSFIQRYSQPSSPAPATVDPRVTEFVVNGRRLVDEGDLDGAAEELSKASVLAEREPTVLLALAELELVRADRLWLQLRLLDRGAEDRVAATRGQLRTKVKRAQTAVDAVVAVGGDDVGVARARVDALRLVGKVKEARQYVAPLSEDPSQPANAYVLAVLDLAESEPALASAIEHLRKAASAEGRIGRARSALIYALALNGEFDAARSELSALAGINQAHPLLPDLRAFVRRVGEEGGGAVLDADELAPVETGDTTAAPAPGEEVAEDFRARLAQANSALRNGHLDQAQRLFQGVLDEQPGNTEAMAGLAEVARQRNDPSASEMYDKVLEKNPSYLPALVARADQKWDAGDRTGALELYQRVLAQAGPATSYGRHAQSRIAQGSATDSTTRLPEPTAPASGTAPAPAPVPAPESPPTETTSPESPPIDTTDLPEFQ